jgi:hypothetical protein
MIPRPLPIVVDALPKLTWAETNYGYSKKLIGWRMPVDIAIRLVEQGSEDKAELELAAIEKDEAWRVGDLVRELAEKETSESEVDPTKKWLFLVLDWLYKNRDSFQDPLQEVEEIYAEFNYPAEIQQMVRFLPPTNGYRPELHSRQANLRRLYSLWSEYLENARNAYFVTN